MPVIAAFFANIWAKAQLWLIAAGAVIVAIGVAFLKGRSSGKAVIIEEQKQKRAEAVIVRKETDEQVDALPPAAVDTRLDKWMRD